MLNVPEASSNAGVKMKTENCEIIKHFEGLRLEAYKCPAGVLTIGYGHTSEVFEGMTISEERAEQLLIMDIADAETAVNTLVTVELNQNQFDALVSFVFNLGSGNFSSSTLLKVLNKGNYLECANQFRKWNRADGKVLEGLKKRRAAESLLFMSSLVIPL